MQIVIDIPKEWFDRLQEAWGWALAENVREAIKSGIILPKGHRRLIEENEELFQSIRQYCGKNATCEVLENAPTIVEADKEVDE